MMISFLQHFRIFKCYFRISRRVSGFKKSVTFDDGCIHNFRSVLLDPSDHGMADYQPIMELHYPSHRSHLQAVAILSSCLRPPKSNLWPCFDFLSRKSKIHIFPGEKKKNRKAQSSKIESLIFSREAKPKLLRYSKQSTR
jgi:hypothetical protein